MNEESKIGYYAVIPSTVLFNEELKSNEKLLYAVITALANKEGYCYASNNYLADLFNSKAHTISNWISHLNKLNFVYVDLIRNNKNEIIQRRIYINDIPYVTKMTYPYTIKMSEGMSQKRQDNNINISKDNTNLSVLRLNYEGISPDFSKDIKEYYIVVDEKVKKFVGEYHPEHYLLNQKEPIAVGPLDVQSYLFEHKAQQAEAMKHAKQVILDVAKDFEKMTGRKYGLFEEYKLEDSEIAIVCMNSTAGTTKFVVDKLRKQGIKAGLLKML